LLEGGTLSERDRSYAYQSRGVAWNDKGDYEHAIPDFTAAIRINPKYAHPYNSRGNAYRELGEFDRAIADYNEAIRLEPTDPFPYHGRANV
jgi:tetratricopeptide (TPR) repeat protein